MERFLWVCFGGALGTGARYLVTGWTLKAFGTSFPFASLSVNLIGSFLIGFAMQVAPSTELLSPTLRIALTAGVLGGFTTYSAFSYEATRQLQSGDVAIGALNIALTTAGCLLACLLGLACARWFLQA